MLLQWQICGMFFGWLVCRFSFLCVKIFKLLNNFSECWLLYPAPTCSWIGIKCTPFAAQILATFARETSALPAQEKDLLRMNNSELLISMSNGDVSNCLILKKLPKLPNSKYRFTSLKLPRSTEILKGFPLPTTNPKMFSCFFLLLTAVSQIKHVCWKGEKNTSWSSHLWSADHDAYHSKWSFPEHEDSLYYWVSATFTGTDESDGWQTAFRSSEQQ